MLSRNYLLASLLGLGLSLVPLGSGITDVGSATNTPASVRHPSHTPGEPHPFTPIQQPLSLKLGVTASGIALIALELWWFRFSKPKPVKEDR